MSSSHLTSKRFAKRTFLLAVATTYILLSATCMAMLAFSSVSDSRKSCTIGWLSLHMPTTETLSSILTVSMDNFRLKCFSLGRKSAALSLVSSSFGTMANMPFSLKQQSLGRVLTCPAEKLFPDILFPVSSVVV